MSPIRAFFRNKWVKVILALDILTIIAVIAVFIFNSTKTAVLNFSVAPVDAIITVNGNSNYRNGSFRVHPGTYEISISHDELDSKSFTFDVQSNDNITVATFLSQDGNFDFYTLRDNFDSFEKLSEIVSSVSNQTTDHDTSAEAFVADFQKNYDLYYTKLPIEYYFGEDNSNPNKVSSKRITIMPSYDCNVALCLKALMVNTDDKELVNSLLVEKGFNMESLQIEYKIF